MQTFPHIIHFTHGTDLVSIDANGMVASVRGVQNESL